MTAEIAILNRSVIALAADSAVTVGASRVGGVERVWKSTNKIFSLSPENDIGVMIFGAGDFCGIPWETILKLFAQQRNKVYSTVADCKTEFVEFVKSFPSFDPSLEGLNSYILILDLVGEICNAARARTKTESKKRVGEYIAARHVDLDNFEDTASQFTATDFVQAYSKLIFDTLIEGVNFVPSAAMMGKVVDFCRACFQKALGSSYETGVVFGGFGSEELFPCLSSVVFDGKSACGVRWWNQPTEINMDQWKKSSAFIIPFAQGDIAHLFIEGIEEGYLAFLETTLRGALIEKSRNILKSYVPEQERVVETVLQEKENEAAVSSILVDFRELRRRKIVDPMLSVVRNLPKEEMAAMAESLVEVTSLRRRMDLDVESVAGPVDVCLISKGDGLVWIKRKHYFDAGMNTEFISRRAKRRNHD